MKRGLRIANLNICHILNKVDEIKILLSEKRSVDILGICETFLNSEISDELITADGFNFERRDREGKSGGGILVYVSQLLNYKRRPDLEGEIETVWLEVSLPNSKPILYCSAYRPPSATVAWIDLFTKQIERASCCGNEIIISGDMNINLLQDPPKYWSDALEVFIAMAIVNGMPVTGKLSSCLKKYYRSVSVACSSAGVMITVNHDVVDLQGEARA